MEQYNRNPDIQKVFDQTWKANNYRQNGIKDNINSDRQRMNKMQGINQNGQTTPKMNHQEQELENLQRTINAVSKIQNNNNFRN